ncbi:MAG: FAD-dependent monooxygenase, partial [Thermoleophilia bacterium]|nr:FAD-dependent monooxygenase [Thermoleophilia bacterium]
MRVVIVGAGMAGAVLARALVQRGVSPVAIERAPASVEIHGPIMLPYQAFDALDDVGLYEEVRAGGREVPPHRDGRPVAIAVGRQRLLDRVREGLDIRWEHELTGLVTDDSRVTGVTVDGPGGASTIEADIVVGADGARSRVRTLAGIDAEVSVSDTAFIRFRSPVRTDEAFLITFLNDGRQLTVLDWPGGSAGGWQIPRPERGAAEALAPGIEAFRRAFARLLPGATAAVNAATGIFYQEVTEVRCETWWRPGVTLIGEALH